jgi:hypothetical protein
MARHFIQLIVFFPGLSPNVRDFSIVCHTTLHGVARRGMWIVVT